MTTTPFQPQQLTLLAASTLAGLSAGFFYTYEVSVTLALAEVDDVTYVKTFQAINETIRNPAFGTIFFGTIPAIAIAIATNWTTATKTVRVLLVSAAALYLTTLFITGTGNVPLNDELAEVVDVSTATATTARDVFEDDWNALNLRRTISCVASFVCLVCAVLLRSARANTDNHYQMGQNR